MVWYFLAGFVAGAIGMLRFASWYVERIKQNGEDNERS